MMYSGAMLDITMVSTPEPKKSHLLFIIYIALFYHFFCLIVHFFYL